MIDRIYRMNRKARARRREAPLAHGTTATPSKIQNPKSKIARARASALITTLLVLVVLSTIVVAFMQSMSVERSVARSNANRLKAEQAAEAGLGVAIANLKSSASPSYFVAQDRTVGASNTWRTVFVRLTNGLAVATNPVESLAASWPRLGTRTFNLASGVSLARTNFALTNSSGETNGSFSFAILDNAAKQNLMRFPSIPRAFATTLREIPLMRPDGTAYSAADLLRLTNFVASQGTNWTNQLLSVPTIKQFLPASSDNALAWADTVNWVSATAPNGLPKIDLRRFKYYIDSLSQSQAANNPKALVVEALLGQPSSVAPVTQWGGGTLQWLVSSDNPGRYTIVQARQIAANLIDYLDDDLHSTTDNIDSPTYLGVEGRLQSDGTVQGHPYITATGFGLVFNFSAAAGFQGWLNSTRVLAYWSLVNPWSAVVNYSTFYTPEIEIEVRGDASGGTLGSNAQGYFLKPLVEQLTSGPSQIAANSGSTYPYSPNGLSYANLNSLQPSNRQPKSMQFSNVRFAIKKMRLKFTDSSGVSSYVQVLDGLGSIEVPMNPNTFILPAPSGGSAVYNPGTVKKGFFLSDDPRLGFQTNAWIQGDLASDAGSTAPPESSPSVAMFSNMDSRQGDGPQGLAGNRTWYSSNATTNHFFVRSAPTITNNPASTPFDPANAPAGLAVDSIAELGYLQTGLPWQTLRMVEPSTNAPVRADYRLLDYVDAGTMHRVTNSTGTVVINGKVNINTASDATMRGAFQGIPGLSAQGIDSIVSFLRTTSNAPYPFAGAGLVGQLTNFQWPGAASKFERENLMRRTANVLAAGSDTFTIFVMGESRDPRMPSKILGRANLAAVVQLSTSNSGVTTATILYRSFY
jgi:Tfp pilus assembly protein PilX